MQGQKYEYELKIREHHLDMFGHMNNATYLQILEEARWEILHLHRQGPEVIKKTGIGPVILEIDIRFKRELLNQDRVKIGTCFKEKNAKLFWIEHTITNQNNELCCEATMLASLFDLNKRKIVPFNSDWKEMLYVPS